MKNKFLDINKVDEDDLVTEEQFFHIMAGAINRLGEWGLTLYQNTEKQLANNQEAI